jgi:hypothetical protein
VILLYILLFFRVIIHVVVQVIGVEVVDASTYVQTVLCVVYRIPIYTGTDKEIVMPAGALVAEGLLKNKSYRIMVVHSIVESESPMPTWLPYE